MPASGDRFVTRWGRPGRLLATLAVCGGLCAGLGACSVPIADLPSPIGLPAGVPARPAQQAEYPAVHDMPPTRQETLLEPEEQRRVQRELERLRDSQEGRAGQK